MRIGVNATQATTGWGGYLGNRGSVSDCPQRRKREPRLFVITWTFAHLRQRPSDGGCSGPHESFIIGSMFTSEAVTRSVRVHVYSQYDSDRSEPARDQWFFLYTITISNEGTDTVQLLTRHWVITDGNGKIEEVRGPGVVGKQPILKPGESFEYTSGCPLPTPFGVMEGAYQMVAESGDKFEAKIAPFTLSEPYTVH